jgi:5S rRNA maturation endonuclease (ribonuclease M5)
MPRGKGQRCSGYLSDDGRYAYCTREEHAGQAALQDTEPVSYRHILEGECRCGTTHNPARPSSEPDATYDYTDANGHLIYQIVRQSGKRFAQRRPDGNGGWVWNLQGVTRVLYRLPTVLDVAALGETVYVVEGEKDVHTIEKAGWFATCNPGGAGKWRSEYADALKGANVIIVADNDEPGIAHAHRIAETLPAATTRLVHAANGCKDVTDHINAGHTLDELIPLEDIEPEAKAAFAISVYSARDLAALELPRPADPVSPHTRAGMITELGGMTGHGKTTFISHEIRQAADTGHLVLVLDLEQHVASIQRVIREAGLHDSELVDYAPIPEGLSLERRSDQLDALEAVLAAKPYRLLVVDPFYKLHTADSNDEAVARELVGLLRGWIARYGFAILTATHCRKLPAGRNHVTIDDFFGSSVFTRDPELVLAIQRYETITKLTVLKSREPGFEHGQTFELLFDRDRGYYPKPTIDPEERAARIDTIGQAALAWITDHPGQSTNKVKIAVAGIAKCGGDLVEEALDRQVKSGLLPDPLKGSRRSNLWYPLNHAALTSPKAPTGEVTESGETAKPSSTSPDLLDFPVGEGGPGSEVDEATAKRLAERHPDLSGQVA